MPKIYVGLQCPSLHFPYSSMVFQNRPIYRYDWAIYYAPLQSQPPPPPSCMGVGVFKCVWGWVFIHLGLYMSACTCRLYPLCKCPSVYVCLHVGCTPSFVPETCAHPLTHLYSIQTHLAIHSDYITANFAN